MSPIYQLCAIQQSDVGQTREVNEDAFGRFEPSPSEASWDRGSLYVVADGLGGHAAGDVASHLAVETMLDEYFHSQQWNGAALGLRVAIQRANEAIYHRSREDVGLREMGTTVVAAAVQADQLTLANVGDSRGYLLRGGRLEQLTRDHSWVAKAVEEGVLSREQARQHPDRNVIYRSLGAEATVEVETYAHTLRAGDRVLLCSDGLTDVMPDDVIAGLMGATDLATAADQLVTGANNRGGPDNITVTLIAVGAPEAPGKNERPTPNRIGALRPSSRSPLDSGQSEERRTVPRGRHLPREGDSPPEVDGTSPSPSGGKRGWLRRLLRRE